MGTFGINVEEGGRDRHRVPQTDHGETSAAVRILDVKDTQGGRSAGDSGNSVRYDLYR